jgi:membrane associated rhomboid family serine protease
MKFKFYAFKLSIFIVLIFIIQVLLSGFTEAFVLNEQSYVEWWRFLTSIFLHGGLGHIAYNLFALLLFGSILESIVGGRRFLWVFFITGVLANLISINFYTSSLGASGAIFGVIGALIVVRPLLVVWAFGLPMPIFVAGILWGIGDVIGAVGFLVGNPLDNTGNIAHLSGMFFGLAIGYLFRKRKKSRRRNRDKIKLDEKSVRNWEDAYLK